MATILHINADESIQKSVQAGMGHYYNVVSAGDGSTAIQYCAMIQPDLILMDVDLPDTDSYGLMYRLKMFMPLTPILLLATDQPGSEHLQQLKEAADGFLSKSVPEEILYQRIESLLPQLIRLSEFPTSPIEMVRQLEAQITALNRANKRLASLNAISALIGTSLDLEHLTDEILQQVQKNVDFDSATLFLLKGNILEAAASRGFSEYRRGMNVYRKNEQNSAWQTVNHKLPLIISDVTTSKIWESRPELERVRSWLGVPLISKDRVVGVLTLDSNVPDSFTDVDARYLFTLSYQIANAVENAQLFEEWENQATRLKLINELGQELTTILDVNNLFEALSRAIFKRLYFDRVAIFEMSEAGTALVLRAQYGRFSAQMTTEVSQHAVERGLISRVIDSGRPILINDLSKEAEVVGLGEIDKGSVLLIPVFVGKQIKAVILIADDEVARFKDQDLWTVSSLANQAATVIENAKLYQEIEAYSTRLERLVEARTQRLQAIRKIGQVVSQGLAINELLSVVGRGINQIFTPTQAVVGSVKVTIGLIDGSNLAVRIIFDESALDKPDNADGPADFALAATYKINPRLPVGEVIAQSKSVILNNVDPQDIYAGGGITNASQTDIRNALMIVPLITAGKVIGMIMVEGQSSTDYDESDLETLEILAFQIANAIEHSRLLQKTREVAIVDERTRLAREMHDGIAQDLAYLLIQVDRGLNMVEANSALETQLEQISGLITQNIDELRRNIFDLRPVDPEGKSFFDVVEKFVAEFGQRWNLRTTCSLNGTARDIPIKVESSLYRVLQEALSNIRQHAHCTRISVKLTIDNEQWASLDISDNGRGFSVGQANQNPRTKGRQGRGLASMHERIRDAGGQLTVESVEAEGTRIVARLPLAATLLD